MSVPMKTDNYSYLYLLFCSPDSQHTKREDEMVLFLHLGLPNARKQKSDEARLHPPAPKQKSIPRRENVNTDLD